MEDKPKVVGIRRGPNTPEGKERVSRNALKHGMTSKKHIVLDGEDPAELDALRVAMREEFEAKGEFETQLADRIALCLFREHRADRIEVVMMDYTFEQTLAAGADLHDEAERFQRAHIALTSNDWLPQNERHLSTNQRRMRQAIQDLRAHQVTRRSKIPVCSGSYHIQIPPQLLLGEGQA